MKKQLTLALAVALVIGKSTLEAQDQKSQVLAAAQAVFDAMAKRDTAALRTLVHPLANFMATIDNGDSTTVGTMTRDQFLARIGASPDVPLERMWNAEVKVAGTIGTVWTQYDFHRGTEFSHCGVDSFQLVRTTTGWQVTSIIYTIVRPASRCKPSPLGNPR